MDRQEVEPAAKWEEVPLNRLLDDVRENDHAEPHNDVTLLCKEFGPYGKAIRRYTPIEPPCASIPLWLIHDTRTLNTFLYMDATIKELHPGHLTMHRRLIDLYYLLQTMADNAEGNLHDEYHNLAMFVHDAQEDIGD